MEIKWEIVAAEPYVEVGDVIAAGDDNDDLLLVIGIDMSFKLLNLSDCETIASTWASAEKLNNWLIEEYGDYRVIKHRRLKLTIKKP